MTQIRFENCPNFRDMNGYAKKNGCLTCGRIYRSDTLSKLSSADIDTLLANTITCVIDLRYASELAEYPNPLANHAGFYYYNVSLSDGLYSGNFDAFLDKSMWEMYIGLAEEATAEVGRVFKIISDSAAQGRGIVFHCTAGKDRTGVIAALLLMTAGVSHEDIIKDYALSYTLLRHILEADKIMLRQKGIALKDHVFMAEPYYMEKFIEHIEQKYGDAAGFLQAAGLMDKEIAQVAAVL